MNHEFKGKVFFNDVDKGGVVYFANYLKILDNARTTMFNEIGFGYLHQEKENKLFAVVNLDISYKKSLYLDEEYTVRTRVEEITNVSMDLIQEILRNDVVITSSKMKIAYLDFNNKQRPTRIPESLKEKLCSH
jgi:acyl-CoA thioester hydrolase